MDIKERVKKALEGLDLADLQVKILENRGTRVLVSVISSSFEEIDEAHRQRMVWGKLMKELGDYDSRRVEFVFTDSPSEIAEASPEVSEIKP
jgi:acid stress-induced BolA-like protein IbaG/YrbA